MSKRILVLMCSVFLIVPLLFMGCGSGSDGSTGAAGATGTTGATGAIGPPGPTTNTNESCMVCHTTGRIADITDQSGGVHNAPLNSLPTLTVGNIVITDNGSGNLRASFNVKVDNTTNYSGLASTGVYFLAADLVPAGTVALMLDNNLQSTDQFERWAYERNSTGYVFGTFDNTDATNGNYVYTFITPLGSTTAYDNAQHFSFADIQRLYIRVGAPVSNTFTNGAGFVDFTVGGPAGARVNNANIGYNARQFVTIEACRKCHGPKMQNMGHGSSYRDTKACTICHSPIINATNSSTKTNMAAGLWLGNWIHQIHSAQKVGDSDADDKDFTDVTYPMDIRVCVTCHTNASGSSLGAGDLTSNWKNHPTAAYCATCHRGFPLTSHKATYRVAGGPAHPGGTSQPDATCVTCHPASGTATTIVFPVATVHDTSPEAISFNAFPKNVPEYDVTLTLSPVKAFYVAGDNVAVTATLKLHGTSTSVPAAVYTNPKGASGIADNALASASLAAYGPRALPKPILNLPVSAAGLVPQSANLWIGSKLNDNTVNPAVKTDATGFKYNLTIPTGLTAGTYGVRVRFGDYGYVSDTNYKTESVAFQTIQIGSATVTPKVAGDGCGNCHGVGDFLDAHDARHAVIFDTDQCISCHDYSGNHASAISNRVHAVHSANTFGDMLNTQKMQTTDGGFDNTTIDVNWSTNYGTLINQVTYPQNINNCATCHNSGNTSYRSVVHEVACLGCHGDNIYTGAASNHMLQSGGKYPAVK